MKNKNIKLVSVNDIERLGRCADICSKIYIARNITLSEKDLLDALKECDRLLRDKNDN